MILRTQVGSGVHGTAISGQDDRDEMGICLEPPEYVTGLARVPHGINGIGESVPDCGDPVARGDVVSKRRQDELSYPLDDGLVNTCGEQMSPDPGGACALVVSGLRVIHHVVRTHRKVEHRTLLVVKALSRCEYVRVRQNGLDVTRSVILPMGLGVSLRQLDGSRPGRRQITSETSHRLDPHLTDRHRPSVLANVPRGNVGTPGVKVSSKTRRGGGRWLTSWSRAARSWTAPARRLSGRMCGYAAAASSRSRPG